MLEQPKDDLFTHEEIVQSLKASHAHELVMLRALHNKLLLDLDALLRDASDALRHDDVFVALVADRVKRARAAITNHIRK
jgi:hypothetical protein